MLLHYSSIVGAVHCDYLNLTMPSHVLDELLTDLNPFFDTVGLSSYDNQTFSISTGTGALKLLTNARYLTLSTSGGMLRYFRENGFYDYFLEIISKYPFKITRLDATADYLVDYAPDTIKKIKNLSMASEMRLTRKALIPSDIRTYMSLNQHGHETGTVYLGQPKSHSVYGKIYDKGHERLSKGLSYIGQHVRVELTLKADTGISLKDIHNPESVFYHFASRSIVSPPPHFNGWQSYGSGYELPKQTSLFTPAGKIQNIFSNSLDISRAIKIALKSYPNEALDVLISQFRIAFLKRQSTLIA